MKTWCCQVVAGVPWLHGAFLFCDDESVIVLLFVMERRRGVVVQGGAPNSERG